jgi:tRNA pseudouridine13 synthase
MLGIPHPYLTAPLPGVGGEIKQVPADFIVEEVPLYSPSGEGEHTYFEIEKTDLSTPEALERLSRVLGKSVKDFGYAGLKDRKGITRQVISIAHIAPEALATLEIPQLKVLWARRHLNKLRVGHLRGNRFRLRIRGVARASEPQVSQVLEALAVSGVPNYYGPQRFGNRGDAHRVGRAFLKHDDRAAVRRILGHPSSTEHNPHVVEARARFMAGEWKEALEHFPSSYREERRLLAYLLRAGENYGGARRNLSDASRKLYCTAYQSYLFNLSLAERLRVTGGDLGKLHAGDIAFLHRNGALFPVNDLEKEAPRATAFEISPSGPIFGMKMLAPTGIEGEIEQRILEQEGVSASDFHQLMPRLKLEGGRRPFRVRAEDLVWRFEESDLCLEFFLPKGSYATTLLREILKNDEVPEGFYEEGDAERHGLWRPPVPASDATLAAEEIDTEEP